MTKRGRQSKLTDQQIIELGQLWFSSEPNCIVSHKDVASAFNITESAVNYYLNKFIESYHFNPDTMVHVYSLGKNSNKYRVTKYSKDKKPVIISYEEWIGMNNNTTSEEKEEDVAAETTEEQDEIEKTTPVSDDNSNEEATDEELDEFFINANSNLLSSQMKNPEKEETKNDFRFLNSFGIRNNDIKKLVTSNYISIDIDKIININRDYSNLYESYYKTLIKTFSNINPNKVYVINSTSGKYNMITYTYFVKAAVESGKNICIKDTNGTICSLSGNTDIREIPSVFDSINKDLFSEGIFLYGISNDEFDWIKEGYIIKLARYTRIINHNGTTDEKVSGAFIFVKDLKDVWGIYSQAAEYIASVEEYASACVAKFIIESGRIVCKSTISKTM